MGVTIDLSHPEAQHLGHVSVWTFASHAGSVGRDAMMLWFGPLDGSVLGLLLLGLAEGVVLAILVSVLAQRYIFRSHQE